MTKVPKPFNLKDSLIDLYRNKVRIRVCGILIKENKLLLVKHKGIGKEGQLWSPPGGGLEFGESVEECLEREFQEETGVSIKTGSFLFVNEFKGNDLHAVELFFSVDFLHGEPLVGHDPEHDLDNQIIQEARFVTISELDIIRPEQKHNILIDLRDMNELLNISGYFKFCQ